MQVSVILNQCVSPSDISLAAWSAVTANISFVGCAGRIGMSMVTPMLCAAFGR